MARLIEVWDVYCNPTEKMGMHSLLSSEAWSPVAAFYIRPRAHEQVEYTTRTPAPKHGNRVGKRRKLHYICKVRLSHRILAATNPHCQSGMPNTRNPRGFLHPNEAFAWKCQWECPSLVQPNIQNSIQPNGKTAVMSRWHGRSLESNWGAFKVYFPIIHAMCTT